MEVFIVIFGTLMMPGVILICLMFLGRKYSDESARKDRLVDKMENIIEMKNKMIKQLKALRILH